MFKAFAFALALTITNAFVSSLLYFWKFVAIDLEEALYALYQIVGLISLIYLMFVVVFFSRSKIIATFNKLLDIYKASERFNIFAITSWTLTLPHFRKKTSFQNFQMKIKTRHSFWLTQVNGFGRFSSEA